MLLLFQRVWKDRAGSNVYYSSMCICTSKRSIIIERVWNQYLHFFWMQENQDWQNRGSGKEERGGAVIVSGEMVWQQLIRLAELWLSNEHPPLWQSSHYVVNHEHTLIRFSIASLRRNQIKEQIARMEPKHKTWMGGKRESWKLCGEVSFMCEHLWITGFLPLIHEYLSTRKYVSAISTQSLPGRLSASVSLQQTAPSKTSEWFRAKLSIYST